MGEYKAIYRALAKFSPTADFRPKRPAMLSSFPSLLEIPEGTEVQDGTLTDKIESYTPGRRGRYIAMSVEMLQNDNLGALTSLPSTVGRRIERDRDGRLLALVVAASTTTTLADGDALAHANHSNLAAGGDAGIPSDTTLDHGLETMGLQTNFDGDPDSVQPRFALVPVTQQGAMLRLKQGVYGPTTAATSQLDWIRNLTVLSHGTLDASSTTQWYLFADPMDWEVFEWTEVAGHAPKIDSEFNFKSDALLLKAVHSFGVGAVDHRGIYVNPGA